MKKVLLAQIGMISAIERLMYKQAVDVVVVAGPPEDDTGLIWDNPRGKDWKINNYRHPLEPPPPKTCPPKEYGQQRRKKKHKR